MPCDNIWSMNKFGVCITTCSEDVEECDEWAGGREQFLTEARHRKSLSPHCESKSSAPIFCYTWLPSLPPIAALESVGPEHCVVGCATVMRLSKYVIMCASPPLFPNAHIHIHTNSHIPLQQTWVQCCAADPTGCEERAQRNGSREVPHAGICTCPLISALTECTFLIAGKLPSWLVSTGVGY